MLYSFRADILNFTNLLNKDWELHKESNHYLIFLTTVQTVENVPTFRMATTTDESGATI
jgi:hypothetical protein